jgi:hypothetical protein
MDNLQEFKEKQINTYLSSVDLTDMNIKQIQQDLRKLIGEEPAVKLNYINEKSLNEDGSEGKRIEKLDSVSITFTINKELLPGKEFPFPITKNYLID